MTPARKISYRMSKADKKFRKDENLFLNVLNSFIHNFCIKSVRTKVFLSKILFSFLFKNISLTEMGVRKNEDVFFLEIEIKNF